MLNPDTVKMGSGYKHPGAFSTQGDFITVPRLSPKYTEHSQEWCWCIWYVPVYQVALLACHYSWDKTNLFSDTWLPLPAAFLCYVQHQKAALLVPGLPPGACTAHRYHFVEQPPQCPPPPSGELLPSLAATTGCSGRAAAGWQPQRPCPCCPQLGPCQQPPLRFMKAGESSAITRHVLPPRHYISQQPWGQQAPWPLRGPLGQLPAMGERQPLLPGFGRARFKLTKANRHLKLQLKLCCRQPV